MTIVAGRTSKILGRLPAFMLAPSPEKALASVASALGSDLDEAERLATNIQRAHRLQVADEARDLLALAALVALHPADFFILAALYEGRHADYVEALRRNVQRSVAILMDGCGTIRALLAGTAVLLDQPAAEIEHLGAFVHRHGSIYLVESPLTAHDSGDRPRSHREFFRVNRGGFFAGPVAIRVTGVGDRTVHPMVINVTTREGVVFGGTVPDGAQLVFTADGTVLLDGVDVSAQAQSFHGALHDYGGDAFVVFEPAGVAQLPLGESDWRFSVKEGAFDAGEFGACVFADAEAGGPSGRLQLAWEEHEPFAATVLIPAELEALPVDGDLPSLVRAGLERFRTAGVRVDVRFFDATWVLDHSDLSDLPPGPPIP